MVNFVYLLVWIMGKINFHSAQKVLEIDGGTCKYQEEEFMGLEPKKEGLVILRNKNFNSSNKFSECEVDVSLTSGSDIGNVYYWKSYKIELNISIKFTNSCLYTMDVFTSDPSRNRAIVTLDCDNNRNWIGHWPLPHLVLKYKPNKSIMYNGYDGSEDMVTTVQYQLCRSCYKTKSTFYSNNVNHIDQYGRKDLCIDDSFAVYKTRSSIVGFCGTLNFNIQGDAHVCYKVYSEYSYSSKADGCQTNIEIDGQPVMDITRNIWKEWCFPYTLKGKVVSFIFKKKSYLCKCSFSIMTNSTNYKSPTCPVLRPLTTTRSWHWSSWSSSDDESDDMDTDTNDNLYKILGVGLAFVSLCAVIYSCKRKCDKNTENSDGGENTTAMTARSELYQLKPTDHNNQPPAGQVSYSDSERHSEGYVGYGPSYPVQPPSGAYGPNYPSQPTPGAYGPNYPSQPPPGAYGPNYQSQASPGTYGPSYPLPTPPVAFGPDYYSSGHNNQDSSGPITRDTMHGGYQPLIGYQTGMSQQSDQSESENQSSTPMSNTAVATGEKTDGISERPPPPSYEEVCNNQV